MLIYYAFFALFGVGIAASGYWARNTFMFVCGCFIFIINLAQFIFWYLELCAT